MPIKAVHTHTHTHTHTQRNPVSKQINKQSKVKKEEKCFKSSCWSNTTGVRADPELFS